jgi:hypothetical protein
MNKTGHHNIAEILLKLILSKRNYTHETDSHDVTGILLKGVEEKKLSLKIPKE